MVGLGLAVLGLVGLDGRVAATIVGSEFCQMAARSAARRVDCAV